MTNSRRIDPGRALYIRNRCAELSPSRNLSVGSASHRFENNRRRGGLWRDQADPHRVEEGQEILVRRFVQALDRGLHVAREDLEQRRFGTAFDRDQLRRVGRAARFQFGKHISTDARIQNGFVVRAQTEPPSIK
jgi:hypothetical protein